MHLGTCHKSSTAAKQFPRQTAPAKTLARFVQQRTGRHSKRKLHAQGALHTRKSSAADPYSIYKYNHSFQAVTITTP